MRTGEAGPLANAGSAAPMLMKAASPATRVQRCVRVISVGPPFKDVVYPPRTVRYGAGPLTPAQSVPIFRGVSREKCTHAPSRPSLDTSGRWFVSDRSRCSSVGAGARSAMVFDAERAQHADLPRARRSDLDCVAPGLHVRPRRIDSRQGGPAGDRAGEGKRREGRAAGDESRLRPGDD